MRPIQSILSEFAVSPEGVHYGMFPSAVKASRLEEELRACNVSYKTTIVRMRKLGIRYAITILEDVRCVSSIGSI
jgi:hypothetical protein